MSANSRLKSLGTKARNFHRMEKSRTFSDEIKREAVMLSFEFGAEAVATEIGLNARAIYRWREKYHISTRAAGLCKDEVDMNLQVTRVTAPEVKSNQQTIVASIKRGDLEVSFFSSDFASKILQELLR